MLLARRVSMNGKIKRSPIGLFHSTLRRRADIFLIAYQFILCFVFLAIFSIFSHLPLWLQLLTIWASAVLTTKFENILHWSIHAPLFRSPRLNRLHRLSFCFIPPPAIFYRYEHFRHHETNNRHDDETTTLATSQTKHANLLSYLINSLPGPMYAAKIYKQLRPGEQREVLISLGASFLISLSLFYIDWYTTLVFWLPVVWIFSFIMAGLYDYLDHVPGNPYNEFLYATYKHPETRYDRFFSLLALHNTAAHLTHHRFPNIHWSDLPKLQERWLSEYKARKSPISCAPLNDLNPLSFLMMIYKLHKRKNEIPVVSIH